MTFASRRWVAWTLTLLAGAGFTAAIRAAYPTLRDAAYFSGWTLGGVMLFLTLYNLRKKLPYPPLFSSALWLQLHAYIGILSGFFFVLHVSMRWPNGPFEVTLALLFITVAVSGVLGLILSRTVPRRLSLRGEEVLFERIPLFRRELREKAESLIVAAVEQAQAMTLADFHRAVLADYFRGPCHTWLHLCQSSRPLRRLTEDLGQLDRYLNDQERQIAAELRELIETKDGLDYHHAMQGLLKLWLFVHIPLTYALLAFVIVHVVLVHTWMRMGS